MSDEVFDPTTLNVGEWRHVGPGEAIPLTDQFIVRTTRRDLPVHVILLGDDPERVLAMASRLEVEL